MRKPSILLVNKFYYPVIGGVERVVKDIADGLSNEYQISVLSCNRQKNNSKEKIGNVTVVRAAAPIVALSMPISINFMSLLTSMARQSDIIHFHSPFPLAEMAAIVNDLNKPFIVNYHSDIVRQRWLLPVYGKIMKAFLKKCSKIIVSSKRLAEHSIHLKKFREKTLVIPFGVHSDITSNIEPFLLPAKDFVLFVGRLVSYKGVEYLIRAMKDVTAPLVIVGDGPLRTKLERMVRHLGLQGIHFLGKLSQNRVKYCISQSRTLVLPSIMNSEAFGLVQLEAMAFGKPVINTDLPTGVPEVSQDGITGITVPPRDSIALAKAISKILDNLHEYGEFSANCVARARELSMEKFLFNVSSAYNQVLKRQ